jgi:hypothetical protein
MMDDLQRHLISGLNAADRRCGDLVRIELDETKYEPKVNRYLQREVKEVPAGEELLEQPQDPNVRVGFLADGSETLQSLDGKYVFEYRHGGSQPRVHYFEFFPRASEADPRPQPEERWFAFNVDTDAESNLRRADAKQLRRSSPVTAAGREDAEVQLFSPGDTEELARIFREKRPDLSESPWLFLIFLLVLAVEQALAVHLSFHLKGAEGTQSGTVAAPSAPSGPAMAA